MTEKINIAFGIDNIFAPKLAATIASVLINSSVQDNFAFHVLSQDLTEESKLNIEKLREIKPFEIEFYKLGEDDFKDCPISGHINIPTWFRLKLASVVNLDKILYLDVDLIVRKSLRNFYNTDIKDVYAAVIENFTKDDFLENRQKVLKIKNYFNAGVLLLNLAKYREDNMEAKAFEYAANHAKNLICHDQCTLNHIFQDNVIFAEKIYNFQHRLIPQTRKFILKEYKKEKDNIVIIHFVAAEKPWNFKKSFDFIFEYYYYLSKTPFKFEIFKDLHDKMTIKEFNKIEKTLHVIRYY